MTTPTDQEWAGLEAFVKELRALEAPVAAAASAGPRPTRATWFVRGGMLAAGLAAVLLWRAVRPETSPSPRPGATRTTTSSPANGRATSPANTVASLLSPWPAVALAQSPGAAPFVPYPPMTQLDGRRLTPRWRTYVRLSANDYHTAVPHEVWVNALDSVRFKGTPAWRLVRRVERRNILGDASNLDDTLWVRREDLRPLARHVNHGSLISRRFHYTDTSVTELDSIYPPKGAKRLAPFNTWRHTSLFSRTSPYIVSSEYLRLLLRAAPLSLTWRASVQVEQHPYNQPNNAGFVNLRVTGIDTVQLFSGRFPTWRVAVEGTMRPETWYVSQQTGETLITDGPVDLSYPESRTVLLYGVEETKQAPSIRRR